mgnify:CR=1 FL=1
MPTTRNSAPVLMPWLIMYNTDPETPSARMLNIPSMQKPRWLTLEPEVDGPASVHSRPDTLSARRVEVQTSRLALELVRLGMGWTVVDFLTATRLDPAQMVAMELPDLPPMSLYSYHASAHPPGLHATRMLTMLPGLLHAALSPHTRK